ncbi:MAG: hypothetical protein CXX68_03035, partial [Thaumarchaeota archaeon]
ATFLYPLITYLIAQGNPFATALTMEMMKKDQVQYYSKRFHQYLPYLQNDVRHNLKLTQI